MLSGGGNLGALQVGMLRALLEHRVRPDLVVGCSVGAINGAGFADDPTPEHVDELERLWIALDGQDLLPSGWSNAVSLARRGEAIHDHEGLRRMAHEALRSRTFEDLDLPFECVATDVAGAEEVWFGSGPLIEPILASSALPAIYPAVEIDGVRYLDGGIVNDVPMSRAVELGAATIYILQVGAFMRERPEPRRPLDVALQAYWVARHHRFKREIGALPSDVTVHVLPTGETPKMRFNDFTHSATLISRAYEAASGYLADLAAGRPPGSTSRLHRAAVTTLGEAVEEVEPGAGLLRRAVGRRNGRGPDASTEVSVAPEAPAGVEPTSTDPPPGVLRRVVARRNGKDASPTPGAPEVDGATDTPAPSPAEPDVPADASPTSTEDPAPGVLRRAVARRNGHASDTPGADLGEPGHANGAAHALRRAVRRNGRAGDPDEPAATEAGHTQPTDGAEADASAGALRRVAARRHADDPDDPPDAGLYIPAGGERSDPDEPAGVRRWARATRLRRLGERPAAPARQTGRR